MALAAVYFGSPYSDALVVLAAVIMGWEWVRLCGGGDGAARVLGLGAGAITLLGAAVDLETALLSLPALLFLAFVLPAGGGWARRAWAVAGMVYVVPPCLAFLWLRGDDTAGLMTLILILVVVWAADTGAFAAGRTFGGPKLAPRVSPNKTWSGFFGAVLSGALAGGLLALALGAPAPLAVAGLGAVIGVVEQGGDLVESAVKRHFGVKDASNLIPGHGGLLDRVDGLMAALLATALIQWAGKGSVLAWS